MSLTMSSIQEGGGSGGWGGGGCFSTTSPLFPAFLSRYVHMYTRRRMTHIWSEITTEQGLEFVAAYQRWGQVRMFHCVALRLLSPSLYVCNAQPSTCAVSLYDSREAIYTYYGSVYCKWPWTHWGDSCPGLRRDLDPN